MSAKTSTDGFGAKDKALFNDMLVTPQPLTRSESV